jgi:uncharacterized protein
MSLYESNFIKLHHLLPVGWRKAAPVQLLSRSAADLDLQLRLEPAAPYTIDLCLTYLFPETDGSDPVVATPDLRLRAYFDARLVEVVSWSGGLRHDWLRQLAGSASKELDRRWARNMMFSKWLDYLDHRGHRFPPVGAAAAACPMANDPANRPANHRA